MGQQPAHSMGEELDLPGDPSEPYGLPCDRIEAPRRHTTMNTNELQDPQMSLEGGIWKLWRQAPRLTALPANELLGQRARQCGRPRVSQ
jgi:hypothetical protein